ncbi:MAG: hypothetical protein OEM25_07590 [Gammaproteobacteria bacterium]|nr:hypothetical protein [Gammaproteobacteria bacterium]
MNKVLVKSIFTVSLLIMLMAVPVYGASVNKSIKIDAGSESDGATTVNGSISVGAGAVVTDTLRTVNGKIRVGEKARIEDAETVNGNLLIADSVNAGNLTTVNGSISLGESASVDGVIEAVNGAISLDQGSKVSGTVSNVNGDMDFAGGEIGGDVSTVNGDVEMSHGAVIDGDLVVKKPNSWGWGNRNDNRPKVVIGPGSAVNGTIRLEREVELFISETATVGGVEGVMSMNDAVRFSGERP